MQQIHRLNRSVTVSFSYIITLEEKTIRVHTLREIESDLRVRKVDDDISDDLAAFNKLLAIVGLKHNIGNPREVTSFPVRITLLATV